MEFCDECGSMMMAEGEAWVCQNEECGHSELKDDGANYVITEGQEVSEVIESAGGDSGLPKTDADCPKCDNDRAYWYMQQIRAADESETRFYVCTECEHKWREDDH
jgi:DNA-directed RNA polymerase subunit M